jgi:hypothetical protein
MLRGWQAGCRKSQSAKQSFDVQRVARDYLRPQQLEIGIAGPPALALELQSLGEVTLYRARRRTSQPPVD